MQKKLKPMRLRLLKTLNQCTGCENLATQKPLSACEGCHIFESLHKQREEIEKVQREIRKNIHVPKVYLSEIPEISKRVKHPEWTDSDDALLRKLREEGKTLPQIAAELNRVQYTISRRIKKLNIPLPRNKRGPSKEDIELTVKMRAEGKTFVEIDKMLKKYKGAARNIYVREMARRAN